VVLEESGTEGKGTCKVVSTATLKSVFEWEKMIRKLG
jgi:hypothetical protein